MAYTNAQLRPAQLDQDEIDDFGDMLEEYAFYMPNSLIMPAEISLSDKSDAHALEVMEHNVFFIRSLCDTIIDYRFLRTNMATMDTEYAERARAAEKYDLTTHAAGGDMVDRIVQNILRSEVAPFYIKNAPIAPLLMLKAIIYDGASSTTKVMEKIADVHKDSVPANIEHGNLQDMQKYALDTIMKFTTELAMKVREYNEKFDISDENGKLLAAAHLPIPMREAIDKLLRETSALELLTQQMKTERNIGVTR